MLVLFTGVLAVSTGLLWWETKKAADAAQKSAEATHKAVELTQMQLRAYVRVNPGRFWELDPDHRTWLSYHLINSGETPAYSLRHGAVLKLAPFPLSDGYPFPDIKLGGETILTKEMTNLTGEVGVEKQLTQDEIITIFKGKDPRLYIFGETRYTTFGEEHSTRFCFSFAGSGNGLALVEKGDWGTVNSQIAASQLYWLHDPTYNKAN